MSPNQHRSLRMPRERVGTLAYAALPPPAIAASDEEQRLLRALRAREERAFEALLDRYYPPMLRLAEAYVRSRDEAEEVVQDTWLAVLAGLDRFEGRSSLKTWIFRILLNRARTRAKREARTVPFSALRAPEPGQPVTGDTDTASSLLSRGPDSISWNGAGWTPAGPEENLLSAELLERIERAVDALPARQREVITLRDVEGWSANEVCELLGLSAGNQRVLLHRARLQVRDALADYVGSPGAGGKSSLADAPWPTARGTAIRPPTRNEPAARETSG